MLEPPRARPGRHVPRNNRQDIADYVFCFLPFFLNLYYNKLLFSIHKKKGANFRFLDAKWLYDNDYLGVKELLASVEHGSSASVLLAGIKDGVLAGNFAAKEMLLSEIDNGLGDSMALGQQ